MDTEVFRRDLYKNEDDPQRITNIGLLKDGQPKEGVFLPNYTAYLKYAREKYYDKNTIPDSNFDRYTEISENDKRDAKALAGIYAMIVDNKKKPREKIEDGKTGIASGDPNSQTVVAIGRPIGWRLGGAVKQPLKGATKYANFGSFPTEDTKFNGGSIQRNLECKPWSKTNFKQWERYHCWICGLPLWWDDKKPEGEHKLPFGFMCVFGPGPITKLCLVEDDEGAKQLDSMTNRKSIYSSISSTLGTRFDENFKNWKDVCRGEEYAWSHKYCNKIKHSINFVKFGLKPNGDYVYYINYSAVKFVSDLISLKKQSYNRRNRQWELKGIPHKAKGGDTLDSVLNSQIFPIPINHPKAMIKHHIHLYKEQYFVK